MTLEEQIKTCMSITVDLWNAIKDIPTDKKHQMDDAEFCRDIHDIQNRLFAISNTNNLLIKHLTDEPK